MITLVRIILGLILAFFLMVAFSGFGAQHPIFTLLVAAFLSWAIWKPTKFLWVIGGFLVGYHITRH